MPTLGQDLLKLRVRKRNADASQKQADSKKRLHKDWERHCLDRMEAEEAENHKTRGTLFSPVAKQYAQIQDREAFVEWALANEPELVQYKERSAELNALVRAALDDADELPPGVGFYVRSYISQRQT